MSNNIVTTLLTADYLSSRKLPVAPDGRYEPAESSNHGVVLNFLEKVQAQIKRGDPILHDPQVVEGFVDAALHANTVGIDDRKMLFQNGLTILQRLDPNSNLSKKLNNVAIADLYNSLTHPPTNYLGTEFRDADGGRNNNYFPNLGRAGQPYARGVPGKTPIPYHELPDPGLVFDTLLKRRKLEAHPGGNSSLTFAFASLITHSLFRTNPYNMNINDTSSYLDLSPLYGVDQTSQNAVRQKDGTGSLYPDVFSEERLGLLPPSVSALLCIFNRNHNYIAANLLTINERKRWKPISSFSPNDPALLQQDEEIFQTARLINCGHFMSVVFGDYVAGFLGLTRTGSSWSMNPFDPIKTDDGYVGRGEGNHVSVEFNLLYRWHATISPQDEKWTEDLFESVFKTKDFDSIDLQKFGEAVRELRTHSEPDPRKRNFAGLVRQPNGAFKDEDIANLLNDAVESPASRYGARGTPGVLRIVEILAMNQARKWGVCTMNEFRAFLGLKQFDSFEEWNPDPEIAGAARALYKHINLLELYPGLQAEQNMPLGSGSGLCCGFTMMRAILADAICLVRGDRFFTTDFTPANLTAWGYNDCQRDPNNGAFGSALSKLLLRNLPQNYRYNSTYGLFAFFTPAATQQNLKVLKLTSQYDFTRPAQAPIPKVVSTLKGIGQVFNDPVRYKVPYTSDMNLLTQGVGMFLIYDTPAKHDPDRLLATRALGLHDNPEAMKWYANYYREQTQFHLKTKSFRYSLPSGPSSRYVDIIQDVVNMTSVHWAADQLCGVSLKTAANPRGLFTEKEAYDMFMILFTCVFEDVDAEHGWVLRNTALQASQIVNTCIEESLKEVMPKSGLPYIANTINTWINGHDEKPCHKWMRELVKSKKSIKDLTGLVIGLAVGSSVNYAQACAQVVDFYLKPEYAKEKAEIVRLSQLTDHESTRLLIGYIKEAQRLAPQFPGLSRVAVASDVIKESHPEKHPDITIAPGDIIFSSYYNAMTDPDDFPDPFTVNPNRPWANDWVQGTGFHGCPGYDYAQHTLSEVIRVIFSLKNLRRAAPPAGILSGFDTSVLGTKQHMYIDPTGNISPWPGSLFVTWDE
ncbi:heme peroxidase [Sistotremastrum niveocremeum HHB9708]|uniref:Heme peroxidase n=1 Tax=Sistotremastrum niveocremeum HHB9708 TaxID=1314777 RepID=A0A164MQ78_9AGAM|nr:heme peroxidase [Sistotremastrum niveocremeum HHB9708]